MKGKIESEIAELPPDEAKAFMADFGIEEPGFIKALRTSYDLLGYQSFFTVGEDEVRACDGAARRYGTGVLWCSAYRHYEGLHPRRDRQLSGSGNPGQYGRSA